MQTVSVQNLFFSNGKSNEISDTKFFHHSNVAMGH